MNAQEEMKEKYTHLYDYMSVSNKPEYMMTFGHVMNEMMDWMIAHQPEAAEEWIGKLESIKWNNYLTPKEAEKIVSGMKPDAPWKRDVWQKAMTDLGIVTEEQPYYNSCALWTEMNKQYSDHAQSLADKVWKKPLAAIPTEELVPAINALALDVLKDKDGVYNIRTYFGV